ncbi:MAG: 3-methylornithine--L-lysine ligase PylC, partial [Firmicutes bacterium]|nr:3-methylornithine--L-lysine ligase PylC [Bacillota bacterium]
MKVAIIGGKLQGTEAVYLSKAAGIENILIDRNPQVPASGFADTFVCGDVVARDPAVIEAMKSADFVLPANENDQVLEAIIDICQKENLKLAFDSEAYEISKSKVKSDALIHANDIPAPRYYPEGEAPYVVKPSSESGSAGVRRIETKEEVEAFLSTCEEPQNWIVQEYLEGPSYSIEVIGVPGNYRTYTITQIHMDDVYDCCKVSAPCLGGTTKEKRMAEIAVRLAELVNLHGIMDVEVIDDGKDLKVLEIDARLPSQTPIAVLESSGKNFVSELADVMVHGDFQSPIDDVMINQGKFSIYEHYLRTPEGKLDQQGEHIMAEARPLSLEENFAGCKAFVSDYEPGRPDFVSICV